MIRKALLVGCKEGPWVPVSDLKPTIILVVKCGPHTRILLHEVSSAVPHKVNAQGEHRFLLGSPFVKASVIKGDPSLVMVTLMGEEKDAVQVA